MAECSECGGTFNGYEVCSSCDNSLSASIVDELEGACRDAVGCCGGSEHWQGETNAFLKRMEAALARVDKERSHA